MKIQKKSIFFFLGGPVGGVGVRLGGPVGGGQNGCERRSEVL